MPAVTRELLITYGSVAIADVEASNGIYNLEASQPLDWIKVGIKITPYGCASAANNGTFTVTAVSGQEITTDNTSSVLEASSNGLIGFPVGGTSEFQLNGFHRKRKEYQRLEVAFECTFVGVADDATFDTYANAIETAFRVPDQRLRVVLGSQVIDNYDPATGSGGNTGFLQAPVIDKPGDKRDSSKSRHYIISIMMEMPADKPEDEGRRQAQESVVYDPTRRRTLTFTGQYTALDTNSALSQYEATIDSYCQGRLASYGGSAIYEKVGEEAAPDKENKVLDYRVVYREIIYDQSAAGLNHAAIVDPSYDYSRQLLAPGDSNTSARRLEVIQCVFNCFVDKTQTTSLDSLWEDTIKPYLIQEAVSRFSLSGTALVDSRHSISKAGNMIRALLEIHAQSDNELIEYTLTVQVLDNKGKRIVEVWDGNPHAARVYSGPARLMRVTSERTLTIGSPGGGATGGANEGQDAGGDEIPAANAENTDGNAYFAEGELPVGDDTAGDETGDTGWITLDDDITTSPVYKGRDGYVLAMTERTRIITQRYVAGVTAGGGDEGGAPGVPTTPAGGGEGGS